MNKQQRFVFLWFSLAVLLFLLSIAVYASNKTQYVYLTDSGSIIHNYKSDTLPYEKLDRLCYNTEWCTDDSLSNPVFTGYVVTCDSCDIHHLYKTESTCFALVFDTYERGADSNPHLIAAHTYTCGSER